MYIIPSELEFYFTGSINTGHIKVVIMRKLY